jgi:predicted HicB family RNase H-like nuclease
MALKKPTLAEDALAFAEGDTKPKATVKKAAVKKTAQKARQKSVPGQLKEGDVKLTANVKEELHTKLKVKAAMERTSISDIVERLLEKYMDKV